MPSCADQMKRLKSTGSPGKIMSFIIQVQFKSLSAASSMCSKIIDCTGGSHAASRRSSGHRPPAHVWGGPALFSSSRKINTSQISWAEVRGWSEAGNVLSPECGAPGSKWLCFCEVFLQPARPPKSGPDTPHSFPQGPRPLLITWSER